MEIWLTTIVAGLIGAITASFGQCVITRSIQGRSWINGRSTCDSCGHQLTWLENLPVFSYVIQRGKSRCCGQRLSVTYMSSELSVALLSAGLVWLLLT